MRSTAINKNEQFLKRAQLCDEQAARAQVRKTRALKLGNQREADGATKTIAEAKENAKWLRSKVSKGTAGK